MKSPIYISALFVLGLGLTGCGNSLTSPADDFDTLDGSETMSKVLERNSMPFPDPTDFGGDTPLDSTKTIKNPRAPKIPTLDGKQTGN